MNKLNKEKNIILQNKLKELGLINISLAKTIEKLKMAALDGDFKENSDWTSLNEKKEILQREIFQLQEEIKELKKTESRFSQKVTYHSLTTGQEITVELTNEWAANPEQNLISLSSPLGSALVNKKIGEIVEVKTQQGNYQIQIIDLK
jgi:transcription elongation factor GreA